jgi:quinol monooxygenase YgiN
MSHTKFKEAAEVLIVAGKMYVPAAVRDSWVAAHHDAIRRARAMPGCLDLYLSADPMEDDRINMFEAWETEEQLDAWRAVADAPPKPEGFKAEVFRYEISSMGPPFR